MTFVRIARLLLMASLLPPLGALKAADDFQQQVRPILKQHCFKCHGETKQSGELRLDQLSSDLSADRRAAEHWQDVREALQRGEMPPEGEPDLSEKQRTILVEWIARQLKAIVAARQSTGGRVVLRRLNRIEYRNTMRDLLGINSDFSKDLPPESLSRDGFLNNGSSLKMSDLQLEYYLAAARQGLSKAIVTGEQPTVFRHTFESSVIDKGRGSNTLDRDEQFVARLLEYPSQGEFLIRVKARAKLVPGRGFPQLRAAVGYRADVQAPRVFLTPIDVGTEDWQTFEFRDRIEHFPLPSKTQSKFPGLLVWLDNAYAEGRDKPLKPLKPKKKKRKNRNRRKQPVEEVAAAGATEANGTTDANYPLIEVQSLEFVGPIFEQWPPTHHQNILFAHDDREDDEAGYVTRVLRRFMTRAFRRPVAAEEMSPYVKFFRSVRKTRPATEDALRETLAMVLISPDFLYLVEPAAENKRPVTEWELAARLSYFLWSTMPDARLIELARNGQLHNPTVLRAEVERMIGDTRSKQFVEQFATQWLDVGAVDRVAVNPEFYPDFDNHLKLAMREETLHFFAEVFYKHESALSFLDSDFTMLNEPLAKHYGLEGPRGSQFQRVSLRKQDRRGGVLTQGSVLLGNSTGADSHPVKRAVWIRERLLDDPPAAPPPNVPTLDSTDPQFASLPIREQLELHREEAACNDCHRGIDPWGIALENFGADGLWRDEILRKPDKGKRLISQPVTTSTALPDGHEIGGVDDLKEYLLTHRREQFARALTSKLLAYALGRGLEVTDEATIEELTAEFIAADYRIADLIQLVVASEPFQSK